MSVQSMACPKCGTWATEYAEGKWQCLNARCQIKFLDKAEPSINVTNQSIVNVNGSSLYDLDLSMKKEHRINHLQYVANHKLFLSILVITLIITGILFGINITNDIPYWITGGCFISAFYFYFQDAYDAESAERIECYSSCPYCKFEFLSRLIIPHCADLKGPSGRECLDHSYYSGLHHCEKCGKQIMVKEDYTCGIRK